MTEPGTSQPSTCIYCLVKPTGSCEHIVLSMLGGNRTSTKIVCGDCNNRFSQTPDGIDLAVSRLFAPLCAQLWIFNGRRQDPPAAVRNLRGGDGNLYDLYPGGIQVPHSRRHPEVPGRGEGPQQFSLALPTMARAQTRLPNLVRQHGERLSSLTLEEVFDPSPSISILYEVRDTGCYRGLMKSLMNWLGVVAPTVARSSELDDARTYVLNPNEDWTRLNINYGISWPESIPFRVPVHAVLVDGRARPGWLVGLVQIFGVLRFSAVLSTNYTGERFSRALIIDPWTRTHSEIDGFIVPDFPQDMAAQLEQDLPHSLERFDRCMQHLYAVSDFVQKRTQMMYGIIRGIQQAKIAKGEDTSAPDVATLIAAQVAHRVVGLPLSVEIPIHSIDDEVTREHELDDMLIAWARRTRWGDELAEQQAAQAAVGERGSDERNMRPSEVNDPGADQG